jgi:TolA-binding protein
MRFVVTIIAVAAILSAASTTPALAQVDSREGIALQNQIYQLRQELKAAEDQIARGGGGGRSNVYTPSPQPAANNDLLAQLLTRVDSLEEQVRQLRGRIDETQNQVQRQNDDLGKRIDDLAFQVNPQGARAPTAPAGAPPTYPLQGPPPTQSAAAAPPRPAVPPAAQKPANLTVQDGNAALSRHDYAGAEAVARDVLSNRTSPHAYDARLLLAQALYGERQYAQAAIAFDDAYNSSRKGSHAQDALLGLAGSLSAINEKKAACDTLARLHSDFPQARPDIASGAAATAQKTGCH